MRRSVSAVRIEVVLDTLPRVRATRLVTIGMLVAITSVTAACSGGSPRARSEPASTSRPAPRGYRLDSELRLNQVQVLGSHNSYHGAPFPPILRELRKVSRPLAASLDYAHRPLAEQFDLGVRQIEL